MLALLALAILALAASAAPASAAQTATMGPIEDVSYASARLTGEVGPTDPGHETYYYFQYSTDGVNWSYGPHAFDPGRSVPGGTATPTPVSEDLTGLKGGTEYFARLQTVDAVDFTEVFSPEPYPSFTTLPVDPPAFVSADPASEVAYTTAKVTGKVERPSGNSDPAFDVNCSFEYVSDQQFNEIGFEFANVAECAQNPIETEGPVTVGAQLEFLEPNTTYHLRLSAENAGGKVSDDAPTFTTLAPSPPTVVLDPVTNVTGTTAHFTGHVTPGGTDPVFATQWEFVCVPSCPGAQSSGTIDPPDNSPHTFEFDPTGLEPNTAYQVKLIATNRGGSTSDEASFQTDPVGPFARTLPGFALGGTEALIGGRITPNNSPTEYWIEYGPGPGGPGATYPSRVPAGKESIPDQVSLTGDIGLVNATFENTGRKRVSNVVAPPGALAVGQRISGPGIPPESTITKVLPGAIVISKEITAPPAKGVSMIARGPRVVNQKIGGLQPASIYHFRIVAENATDTSEGEDVSFETLPIPTPPPASCPNDKLRSETNSGQLEECRAYELSSSPDKNGGDVNSVLTETPDGNRIAYFSRIGFNDPAAANGTVSYMAERTSTGWSSEPMSVPAGVSNLGTFLGGDAPADFNDDLSKAIHVTLSNADEPRVPNVTIRGADGTTTWVTEPTISGPPPSPKLYVGRSADASHVVFESSQPFTGTSQVWEWDDGQVSLISILPESEGGGPAPQGATVGAGANATIVGNNSFDATLPQPTAVSNDGSRIFFAVGAGGSRPAESAKGLYVRENGTTTRRLDLSQREGSIGDPPSNPECATKGVCFMGAARDGSIAVFASSSQLTDDATVGGGLYAFDLEDDKLRFLSTGATDPAGARYLATSLVSDDGSHVYFVARSILVPGHGVDGGYNLYLSDSTGVHFVATLASDDFQDYLSPLARGISQPSITTTPDNRSLVFESYERLTSFDNAGHSEVYRFDVADETLTCVSCGSDPDPATGDASILSSPTPRGEGSSASIQANRAGAVTEDGRILFQTTQALLPADVNGLEDVYLYRDGQLSLISTGASRYDSEVAGITPDGASVFFSSRDSLVGQDIDGGNKDVYAARIDGGFPAPPVANPCEGEAGCQGKPSAPPGFVSPATTAPARGNPPSRHKKKPHKPCKKAKAKKKHAKCGPKKTKKHNASKNRRSK